MELLKTLSFILLTSNVFCELEINFGPTEEKAVAKFIGDLIYQATIQDSSRIHDVAIIRWERENNYLINEIVLEVRGGANVLIVPGINQRVNDQRIRAAAFIIIITDVIETKPLIARFAPAFDSTLFQTTGKFIFVAIGKIESKLTDFFDHFGILDFVILHRDDTWKFRTFNRFCQLGRKNQNCKPQMEGELKAGEANIQRLFPDKLKNMHGYRYRFVWVDQTFRVFQSHGKMHGIDAEVLNVIAQHQNAEMAIGQRLALSDPEINKKIANLLSNNNSTDISLSTELSHPTLPYRQLINTYDVDGFCVVVVNPDRLSFLSFVLSPFDSYSWILMVSLTVLSAIFWRLLNRNLAKSTPATYFVFGIVANFLGQTISFRSNRIQKVLLQLCILMTLILGNAYQSLIIASLSFSREGIRWKTLDELLNDNYKFHANSRFVSVLINSGEYPTFVDRLFTTKTGAITFKEMAEHRVVAVQKCFFIHSLLYNGNHTARVSAYYYLLPDMLLKFYEKLTLPKHSPFFERLQTYHNVIFESGLRQHLKIRTGGFKTEQEDPESSFLKFEDLIGVFNILTIGLLAATFILILEIFIKHWRNLKLKIMNCKNKMKRATRAIKVQPTEP